MDRVDRRRFTRVPCKSEAIISCRGVQLRGSIQNLSIKGAFIKLSERIEVGLDAELEIFLDDSASDVSIILSGKIVRHTADGMAIDFSGMYLDHFERLRDIVKESVGSRRKVLEEFFEYMAGK